MNYIMLAENPAAGANLITIGFMAILGLSMYFLMWRPQKKKEKQQAELQNSIDVGDEITTIGGIVGRVVSIKEDTFVLETASDRSRIRFKRWAIQTVGKLELDTSAEAEQAIEGRKSKADK